MKTTVLFLNIIIGTGLLYLAQGCAPVTENELIIAGEVTDASSGNALEGALVEVTSPEELSDNYTQTNAEGIFSLSVGVDEPTDVTIQISYTGYSNVTRSLRIAPENDIPDLAIEMGDSGNNSGGGGGNNDEENEVGGEAGGPASLILASIQRSSIAIRGTGGEEHSAFTFVVKDSAGRTIKEPAEVRFSIIRGPDGGEEIQPASGFTNSNGSITSSLISGDSAGAVKIEAVIERPEVNLTIRSMPVLVAIGNGFPVAENFHIAPTLFNYEAFGVIATDNSDLEPNIIIASLGDYNRNPVLPGTAVDFTTTGGKITASAITDEDGFALVELFADGSRPSGHPSGIGFVTVTAKTVDDNDNYITTATDVLFTTRQATITANPMSFNIANGGGEAFTYTVTDQNGYPMAAGTTIKVEVGNGLTVSGDVDIEVPDSFTPGPGRTDFGFAITDADPDRSEPANDNVTIVVTTPSGERSSLSIPGSRAKTIGS